jgi:hypothetical protein
MARQISPNPTLQYTLHLDLRNYGLSPPDFIQQLAFSPRLISGVFTISGINTLIPTTNPVRLEQIQSLTLFPLIKHKDLGFLGTHISGLSDTLTELSIDGLYKPYPRLFVPALIPHRGEGLTDLTLMNLDVGAEDLMSFLIGCDGLISLYIRLPSVRETDVVATLQRTNREPQSLGILPALNKFTIVIFMDCHDYNPDFFEAMITSRRDKNLLRISSRLIQIVNLIHIGGGAKLPKVNRLKESLQHLQGFELYIDGPEEFHQDTGMRLLPDWSD